MKFGWAKQIISLFFLKKYLLHSDYRNLFYILTCSSLCLESKIIRLIISDVHIFTSREILSLT